MFLVAWVGAGVVHAADNYVDFGKANDYYAARASGKRIDSIEQIHLGPCEQSLAKRLFPKATAECNFILRVFPNHPRALHATIKICQQSKADRCNLTEEFQQAVAINPKASATFVLQGIYYHGARKYPEAIRSLETALQLDPESMNAHYNLALTLLETKAYDRANSHAQEAYALGATLPGLRERLVKAGHWKQTGDRPAAASKKAVESGKSGPSAAGDPAGKP